MTATRATLVLMFIALVGAWSVAAVRLSQFHSYEVAAARV
jgi:hypothetical protein